MLERLEAERVVRPLPRIGKERQLGEARKQLAAQESVLRELLDSSAFGLGDRLSRLRGGGRAASWRQRVRRDPRRRRGSQSPRRGRGARGGARRLSLSGRGGAPKKRPTRRSGAVRRQLALCRGVVELALQLRRPGRRRATARRSPDPGRPTLGLGPPRPALPVDLPVARTGDLLLPLLGELDVRLDPSLDVADQVEGVMVDHPEVGRHHLRPAARACMQMSKS